MASNIFDELKQVYVNEVIEPKLGKKEEPKSSSGDSGSGAPGESSEKRVRQAVYDIRYRARREDVPLEQAFSQYMSNTSMNAVEKDSVKEKLGIGPGKASGGAVKEESEMKKYKVRVTDKMSGKSYVRMATREKINQLRSNKNISSVEMTSYGDPYEGEKKKGKQTAKVASGKGLDPVGREDKDIDNDGDHDKSDKYLLNRRKVRGAAISKNNVKENLSNWRQELSEVVDTPNASESEEKKNKVVEKKVNNKVVINPKISEGFVVESLEITDDIINQVISNSSQYFYEEGLNEYGIDLLIEEIGLDSFVEFIFDLNEQVLVEKLETRLQKKAGKALKGPKGSKVQSATNAALKKHGLTRKIDSDSPSSTIKKNRKVEAKPEVKTAVQKAKENQPKKRPVLDAIARQVNKGMERHRAAMSAARETGKTIGKAAKGASHVAKGFASGVGTAAKVGKKVLTGEEVEINDDIFEGLTNAELYFLSDDLIEEIVTEVFFEYIEEGYEIDHIQETLIESLDQSYEVLVEADRYASAVETSKKNAAVISKRNAQQRRAEKIKKVKDTVRKVASNLKSGAKKAVKSAAYGAGYAAGKTVSGAKKATSAIKSAGEKAKEVSKKVTSAAKSGYESGSGDEKSQSSGSYRIKYKESQKSEKKQGILHKIGSHLKKNLKKAVGKTARSISKGAEKVASRLGEDTIIEKAPPGSKFERMVKHVKKGYAEGGLTKKEKGIAYATAWKQYNKTKSEEVSFDEAINTKIVDQKTSADDNVRQKQSSAVNQQQNQEKKKLSAQKDKMRQQEVQILQRKLQALRSAPRGSDPSITASYQPEGDIVNELNRYEREKGINTKTNRPTQTGGAKDDKAYIHVKKSIRKMEGTPAGQRKKVPGKKPPTAGQYGAPASPAQKVAKRRADAKRSQDNMSSRFD